LTTCGFTVDCSQKSGYSGGIRFHFDLRRRAEIDEYPLKSEEEEVVFAGQLRQPALETHRRLDAIRNKDRPW
jgi:hypothetical protein